MQQLNGEGLSPDRGGDRLERILIKSRLLLMYTEASGLYVHGDINAKDKMQFQLPNLNDGLKIPLWVPFYGK